MKLHMKIFVLATMVLGLLFASTQAFAQEWRDHRERATDRIEKMHDSLGLSDEQRDKLKAHRKAHREHKQKLQRKFKAKRQALRDELQKTDVDRGKVKRINAELKELMSQKSDHRIEGVLNVRDILTPEQLEKFNAITEERRQQQRKGSQ